MENNRFLCPKCRTELKVKNSLIFVGVNEKKEKGLILLSPELGNYQLVHPDGFYFAEGEHIEFHCPVCQADLSLTHTEKHLAEVLMIDSMGEEYEIVFSEIAGNTTTIQVKNNKVVDFYGEDDPSEFMNIWGSSPQY
jgi:uncharacterized protein YbaR (Trm112 family)